MCRNSNRMLIHIKPAVAAASMGKSFSCFRAYRLAQTNIHFSISHWTFDMDELNASLYRIFVYLSFRCCILLLLLLVSETNTACELKWKSHGREKRRGNSDNVKYSIVEL